MSDSPAGERNRDLLLMLGSIVASLVLVVAYLAAGGASYSPAQTTNPCVHRPWRNVEGIEQIAYQFSLSALEGAACKLGVSRERLARALATAASRERFMREYRITDVQLVGAIRAGLLRGVSDAEEAGALSPLVGVPLRQTLRSIPLERAIELVTNGRSLFNNLQSFLGPAQGVLEKFLP